MTADPFLQDITNCFEIENGFDQNTHTQRLKEISKNIAALHEKTAGEQLSALLCPEDDKDLAALQPPTKKFKSFEEVIIVGTGGSSAGARTLNALRLKNENPRLTFIDNVSVAPFETFIDGIDWAKTGVIVISKSGSTGETLTQFLILLDRILQAGTIDNVIAITEHTNNPLRRLSEKYNIPVLDHDPKIGGRFSVFSLVGMFPAMAAGLDTTAIRAGARTVLDDLWKNKENSSPAIGAAIATQAMSRQKMNMHVMFSYVEQLHPFTFWYRQLWAESLGKEGRGSTPVTAMGPVDQHSQLQLYLDGPRDKFFTLIQEDVVGQGLRLNADLSDYVNLDYLKDKSIGDLLAAQQKAAAETLANNGRPVRLLKIPRLDEYALGGLLMHFMIETVLAADLIGVNAFNQPAVEQGKLLTKEYLRSNQSLKLDAA